jgi:hypothetical protein
MLGDLRCRVPGYGSARREAGIPIARRRRRRRRRRGASPVASDGSSRGAKGQAMACQGSFSSLQRRGEERGCDGFMQLRALSFEAESFGPLVIT